MDGSSTSANVPASIEQWKGRSVEANLLFGRDKYSSKFHVLLVFAHAPTRLPAVVAVLSTDDEAQFNELRPLFYRVEKN